MSDKKWEVFAFDTYIAILKIENIARNFRNATELYKDFVFWDSVIREFEIIGEATRHLLNSSKLQEKFRVVVDFRNLLIHNYFG